MLNLVFNLLSDTDAFISGVGFLQSCFGPGWLPRMPAAGVLAVLLLAQRGV